MDLLMVVSVKRFQRELLRCLLGYPPNFKREKPWERGKSLGNEAGILLELEPLMGETFQDTPSKHDLGTS